VDLVKIEICKMVGNNISERIIEIPCRHLFTDNMGRNMITLQVVSLYIFM